jgi:hypothetical protein
MAAMRVRPRSVAALLFIAGLVLGGYALAVRPVRHVGAHGVHTVLLKEFGAGAAIVQTFTMKANGLNAVDVLAWASDPADVSIECTLSSVQDGVATERTRWRTPVVDLVGLRRQRLEFPMIQNSAGGIFALAVQVTGIRPRTPVARPEVALMASEDRPLGFSSLFVGHRERWGNLVFDTRAAGETVLGGFALDARPNLPAWLRRPELPWAWFLLSNALLVAFVMHFRPTVAAGGQQQAASVDPSPPRNRARGRIGLGLIAAAIGVTLWAARAKHGYIDLVDELYAARLQSTMPLHQAFDVKDVEIGVETMRVIFAHSTSRVAWHLTVPPGARLRTALALEPFVWTQPGDGVVFRVSVAQGERSTPVLVQHVDPQRIASDRRWIPIDLDLSPFAGQVVDLIFETVPSLDGQPVDGQYDWALWGAPRLVVQ